MSLIIDLTPSEEAQISAAAKQTGLAPSEWVKKLVAANLPAVLESPEEDGDINVRHRQEQDGTALRHDVSTQALFAQWVEEDARLTEEERTKNECIYAEIEKNGIPRVQI
jgi:hypothetical protein